LLDYDQPLTSRTPSHIARHRQQHPIHQNRFRHANQHLFHVVQGLQLPLQQCPQRQNVGRPLHRIQRYPHRQMRRPPLQPQHRNAFAVNLQRRTPLRLDKLQALPLPGLRERHRLPAQLRKSIIRDALECQPLGHGRR